MGKLGILSGFSAGMTLVEVAASLSVGSVGLMAASSFVVQSGKSLYQYKSVDARDELVSTIRRLGASKELLLSAANRPGNDKLKACLAGIDGTRCGSLETYPLFIYGPTLNSLTTITGSVDAPKLYSASGASCDGGSGCRFQVSTSFRAQCRANIAASFSVPATCAGQTPEFVEIFYSVKDATTGTYVKNVEGTIIVEL